MTRDPVAHALAYPFDLPDHGYVFARGRAFPVLDWRTDTPGDTVLDTPGGPAPAHALFTQAELLALAAPRTAVVACGSNGAPLRLAEKFAGGDVVPTLRVRLTGYAVVHSAKIAAYGSIPATLHRQAGAVAEVFVNLLDEAQLAAMDETETLGIAYDRPELPREAAHGLPANVERLHAYVSRHGAMRVNGAPAALAAAHQAAGGLAALTQEGAQAAAMAVLQVRGGVPDFIRENVGDAQLRQRRSEALRDRAGLAFE